MPLCRAPLRRVRNTFCHNSDEDAVMSDATTSTVDAPVSPAPLAPSRSVNGSTLSSLGSAAGQPSKRASKRIAAMTSSTTTPEISTPVCNPIDNTSTNIPEPSSSTSRCPEPAYPAATEIAYDVGHVEQSHEERIETLRAAGIKVRNFAYEPTPISIKAPEVFDPVPCLIATDWHMRNPDKNHGLLTPEALFRLLKIGWLALDDIGRFFSPYAYVALAQYNDKPDEQRYPFVVVSQNETIPNPSRSVRLRRQAGLATYPDDYQDKVFLGYNPTGYSDDEGEWEGDGGPPPRAPTPTPPLPAETTPASTSVVVKAEAEAVVVEEPKSKRRKVKGTTKTTRSRAKSKPLRR